MISALKVGDDWNYWEVPSHQEHHPKPDYGLPSRQPRKRVRIRFQERHGRSPAEILELADAEVRESFERDRAAWRAKSKHMSSPTDVVLLPEYQRIIGLGRPAVPLIIESLREKLDYWFWALRSIVGEDHATEARTMRDAADSWISWYDALIRDE